MNKKFYQYRNLLPIIFLAFFSLHATQKSYAQPILSLNAVIDTGLSAPIQLVNAGDASNRIFIVQKGGTIRAYDSAFQFLSLFATVSGVQDNGERGLLSMAFHPNYSSNGFFYVYYVNVDGNLELARYHVSANPNVADGASKVIVLTIPHPTNSNHNGGELHFGSDGFLYLSTGDGGGGGDQPNNAQNTTVLLGKILRLNANTSATAPYYSVPAGNPYNNEVFDLGLRNPFRWSFDRLTNDMWIGDVGQDSYEEINYRAAGATGGVNFGWRCYEANNAYNTTGCAPMASFTFPVYAYPTQNPAAAITGGIVYRGTGSPALYGYYVAADFYSGTFYIINPDGAGGWTTNLQTLPQTGIVDFGETENGEAYVVSLTSGAVYRLSAVSGGPLPVNLVSFGGNLTNNVVVLNWATSFEQNLQSFDIEYSLDGSTFKFAGMVQAKHSTSGAAYSFSHDFAGRGIVFYRLKMTDEDGTYRYSQTVRINMNSKNMQPVYPSEINDGIVHLYLDDTDYSLAELISSGGTVVLKKNITGQRGLTEISAGNLKPGIYVVRLSNNTGAITQKIVIR